MNDDKYGANDRGLNTYNIRRKDELVKENERLRDELMVNAESGDAARKERNEALAEIERLRELLVRCVPLIPQHWELGPNGKMTAKELEKEVSDESF